MFVIVGDYYINNALVVAVLVAAVGGLGYSTGVFDSLMASEDQQVSERDFNLSVEDQNISAGSTVSLSVTSDGRPVDRAEVFVDGSMTGYTTERGIIRFAVPDVSEFTVRVSTSRSNASETFQVDVRPRSDDREESSEADHSVDIVSPSQSNLSSLSLDVEAELAAPGSATYRIYLGGEQKASGSFTGDRTVSTSLEASSGGERTLKVEVLDGGEIEASESVSLTFEEGSEGTGPGQQQDGSITVFSPGENVEAESFQVAAVLQASEADYRVSLDGDEVDSGSFAGSKNLDLNVEVSEPGTHLLNVSLLGDEGLIESSVKELNVTFDSSTTENGIVVDGEVKVSEFVTVSVYRDGSVLSGQEVFLNGGSIGSTGDAGSLEFQVPDRRWVNLSVPVNEVPDRTLRVQDYDPYRVSLTRPENGTELEGHRTRLQFSYNTSGAPADSFKVFKNEDVYRQGELNSSFNEVLTVVDVQREGLNRWHVSLLDGSEVVERSDVGRFYRKSDEALTSIEVMSPSEGGSYGVNSTVRFEWSLDTPSEFNLSSVVESDGYSSENLWENRKGSFRWRLQKDLPSGQYTWNLSVTEHGSIVKSKEISFTVN